MSAEWEYKILRDGTLKLFRYLKNDINVIIPEEIDGRKVTVLDNYLFFGTDINSVIMPDSIVSIGMSIFSECKNLEKVVLSKNISEIPVKAFYKCISLTHLDIPDKVTDIGCYSIAYCKKLHYLTLPRDLKQINITSFYEYYMKEFKYFGDNISVFDNMINECNRNIPIAAPNIDLDKVPVKCKKSLINGFLLNDNLYSKEQADKYIKAFSLRKKYFLPIIFEKDNASILNILSKYGFINKKNINDLFNISQENNATNCTAFLLNWKNNNISEEEREKMEMRDLLKDPYNVADMKKIWSYRILEDDTIEITSYKGKDIIVEIPPYIGKRTVTKIGENALGAFLNKRSEYTQVCSKIVSVSIPDTITYIGENAFHNTGIKNINIPDSVTYIGDSAFCYCFDLQSIKLSNNLKHIGHRAFYNCFSLTSINIPDSVNYIGKYAFGFCDSLQNINIPNSISAIEDCLFYCCKSLQSIILPENITSIGDYAFYECNNLQSIDIPNSVTSIGKCAFYFCVSLQNITIPESVIDIGHWAFEGCRNLKQMNASKYIKTIIKTQIN